MPIKRPPIFLVGCPRSGTTLLSQLVKSSSWGEPFETHFIPKYYRKLDRDGSLTEFSVRKRLVRHILSERPIRDLDSGLDAESFCRSMDRCDYSYIVDRICSSVATSNSAESWADKTPSYVLELELIHALFPMAKVIHIVRDGRDVALSLFEKAWGPNNIYTCAAYWRECNRQRPVHDQLKRAGLLHLLRYEDLLENPESTLRGVLNFLGEICDQEEIAQRVKIVMKDHAMKCKNTMSASHVEIFEKMTSEMLVSYGYEVGHCQVEISMPKRLGYVVHDRIIHAGHLFHSNIVEGIKIGLLGKRPFAD